MRHRLLVHIVWTTRDREAVIDARTATDLADHLPRIASEERANVVAVGIVATHVHILVRLHPITSIPRLLQRMKGGTARDSSRSAAGIRWARGYNIQSVSIQAMDVVSAYVRDQHRHHPREAIPGWPPPRVRD
jgi:REP element-mobilizing transposase RayT